MPSPVVQSGLYSFFTRAELDAEVIRYKSQVRAANTQLAGAGVNGQSFNFVVQGREMSLPEWAAELQSAYAQLGVTDYGLPPLNRRISAF